MMGLINMLANIVLEAWYNSLRISHHILCYFGIRLI